MEIELVFKMSQRKIRFGCIDPVDANDGEVLILHPDSSTKARTLSFRGAFDIEHIAADVTQKLSSSSRWRREPVVLLVKIAQVQKGHL